MNLALHSSIQGISIAPLQVHYYSEVCPTQHEYCVGVWCQSATSTMRVHRKQQGTRVACHSSAQAFLEREKRKMEGLRRFQLEGPT